MTKLTLPLLIISLNLDINSGCCCKFAPKKETPKVTKNNKKTKLTKNNIKPLKNIKPNVPKNISEIIIGSNNLKYGKNNFKRTKINESDIDNKNFTNKSYTYEVDSKLFTIIFKKCSKVNVNFASDIGHNDNGPFILVAMKYRNKYFIVYIKNSNMHDDRGAFNNVYQMTDIKVIKSGKITNCNCMFANCFDLETADLSALNTSKTTRMNNMFSGCWKLKSLDISNFNTFKVTDMDNMFHGCEKLKYLNLISFDTSKVTNYSHIFNLCEPEEIKIDKNKNENICNVLGARYKYNSSSKTFIKIKK